MTSCRNTTSPCHSLTRTVALCRRGSLVASAVSSWKCVANSARQRLLLVQMLDRRPGDRQAVEGRGAAPDLVEDDQRAFAGLIEDRGGLHHLDHEGRASAGEIVGRADAREQAVDDADLGPLRRHEAAHLREHDDQRVLAQERRLARHVRAGEQPDSPRARILRRRKIAVVGDERIADRLLDHGVAGALDDEVERTVDLGAHIGCARPRASPAPLETSSTASASAAALIVGAGGDRRGRELARRSRARG